MQRRLLYLIVNVIIFFRVRFLAVFFFLPLMLCGLLPQWPRVGAEGFFLRAAFSVVLRLLVLDSDSFFRVRFLALLPLIRCGLLIIFGGRAYIERFDRRRWSPVTLRSAQKKVQLKEDSI